MYWLLTFEVLINDSMLTNYLIYQIFYTIIIRKYNFVFYSHASVASNKAGILMIVKYVHIVLASVY